MEEAAAEAASRAGIEDHLAAVSHQLEVLRRKWSFAYSVGHDAEHGWWATRHCRVGHLLTAGEPDELDTMITDDYGPVSQ